MRWNAPATGIEMCHSAVSFEGPLMSAYGYKQTSSRPKAISAYTPASDILGKAGKV